MELPDFMSYASKFSASDFVDKISRIAKRAGAKLVYAALILYYTLQSDNVSKTDKALIIGALGYMISPLDAIPDAIPIVGLTDDLAVLLYVCPLCLSVEPHDALGRGSLKLTAFHADGSRHASLDGE